MDTVSIIAFIAVLVVISIGVVIFADKSVAKIKVNEKSKALSKKREVIAPAKKAKGKKSRYSDKSTKPASSAGPKKSTQTGVYDCNQNGHQWKYNSQACQKVCLACNIKVEDHQDTVSEYGDDGYIYNVCKKCGKKTYDAESSQNMGMWS